MNNLQSIELWQWLHCTSIGLQPHVEFAVQRLLSCTVVWPLFKNSVRRILIMTITILTLVDELTLLISSAIFTNSKMMDYLKNTLKKCVQNIQLTGPCLFVFTDGKWLLLNQPRTALPIWVHHWHYFTPLSPLQSSRLTACRQKHHVPDILWCSVYFRMYFTYFPHAPPKCFLCVYFRRCLPTFS